jgi:MFS family permease
VSMIAFEAIAVTTAMPAVARALDGLDAYALAFGGALATALVAMVAAGNDCDRHGPARSLGAGLALFAAGLLLAGSATGMGMLVLGRLAQGLGIGAIGVALYVAAGRLYPDALRPRLFALFAAAWVVPAILGPGIAGLLVLWAGWRWVFLSVLCLLPPVALLVLPALRRGVAVEPAVMDSRAARRRIGWAVLAGLAALLLHQWGRSPPPGWMGLAGLFAGVAVLWLSARALLPAGSLRAARGLPTVILLRGRLGLHAGWGVAAAGLALSAGALCWSFGSALQTRVVAEAARRRLLRLGFAIVASGTAGQLLVVLGLLPAWTMIGLWALAGLGIGMAFPILSVLVLGLSATSEQGRNSAALQQSEAIAHSALLALAGALFAALHPRSPQLAFVLLFAVPAALTALGALLATRVAPR